MLYIERKPIFLNRTWGFERLKFICLNLLVLYLHCSRILLQSKFPFQLKMTLPMQFFVNSVVQLLFYLKKLLF